jgi:serine/threonine-protein kinase
MPPEQALGHVELVGPKSDLWSLGATLFTLVSGRLVHEGTTVNEQLLSAMTQSAPPLEMVAPCVSPEVAALIDRALSREKSGRFEDALSMQQAVREAYDALPESFDSFDHLPTVIVNDGVRRSPPPKPPSESVRPPNAAVTQTVPSALPTPVAIPSRMKHRTILTAASVGFVVVAAFYAFHETSPSPRSPGEAAILPAAPQTAPAQPENRAIARTPSPVPSARASLEATPKALSVDELPIDTGDESDPRAHSAGGAPAVLVPAMARVAGESTPPAALPAAPVQPREVHLEETPPSPYDDPNPYDDPAYAYAKGHRAQRAPAQGVRR